MVCDSYAVDRDTWIEISDYTAYGLVTASIAWPAYQRDWHGATQAGLSVASGTVIGEVMKARFEKDRPDMSDNDSFPSNHTVNAFSAATNLHIRHGWRVGLPAYGIATLAGVARVEADKHYWEDVLAGAAIGIFTGWLFTDSQSGQVYVAPWWKDDATGVYVSARW
nr:phosphatase PAP2 family protein [Thaumasiovibrio subtropicus]